MAYQYDQDLRRYRDTSTGRFVSQHTIDRTREAIIDQSQARIGSLTDRLHAGEVSLSDWRTAMRAEIKQVEIQQYTLGRGGRNAMTPRDWGRIGAETRRQYRYLDRLMAEYQRGEISDAQFRARARMYTSGSNAAFSRAQEESWRIVLPDHPGSGNTRCMANCKCSWSITQTATEIHATWTLGGSRETCSDCVRRSREWAPLRFDRVMGTRIVEQVA